MTTLELKQLAVLESGATQATAAAVIAQTAQSDDDLANALIDNLTPPMATRLIGTQLAEAAKTVNFDFNQWKASSPTVENNAYKEAALATFEVFQALDQFLGLKFEGHRKSALIVSLTRVAKAIIESALEAAADQSEKCRAFIIKIIDKFAPSKSQEIKELVLPKTS